MTKILHFLHCFDIVGLVTGKASGQKNSKNLLQKLPCELALEKEALKAVAKNALETIFVTYFIINRAHLAWFSIPHHR